MTSNFIVEFGLKMRVCRQQAGPALPGEEDALPGLKVFVIFTDCCGTLAPLQMADQLAQGFEACFRLLWPYEVPDPLPLTNPPIPIKFLEEQFGALASKIPMEIAAHIYLWRDKHRLQRLILKPGSIVILGGRKWWWSAARKLARALKHDGYHVIFAASR